MNANANNSLDKKYRFTEPLEMNRSTHFGNNYWIFRSRKLKRRVTAFSNIEYWHLVTLEMNPSVEYYCEQPLSVEVSVDGENRKTVFDAWVLFVDGTEEYREVKDSAELERQDKRAERDFRQISAQETWCRLNDKKYRLITDKDLLLGPEYMRNLTYLMPK